MLKFNILWIFFLLFGLTFCTEKKQENNADNKDNNSKELNKSKKEDEKNTQNVEKNTENGNELKKPRKVSEGKTDRKFNDLAKLIAGMPADEGSVYASIHESPEFKNYAGYADGQWKNILETKRPKLIKWREEELKEVTEAGGRLFYPFSGPDFLHAGTFFPEVSEIVMIGLEPIGTMPDMDKIAKQSLGGYFNGIQRSLASVLQYSFFQTISMGSDFTGRVVSSIDGTLPVIMLFMARTNHKVLDYEKMALNEEGKLVPAEGYQGNAQTYYATRIDFQRGDKPEERKSLYYFSVNLCNDAYEGKKGLNEHKPLLTYLQNLKFTDVYIKSASYLMYKPVFSTIKDIVLNGAKYVLKDDSGMYFNNFVNDKWDITLFGRYAGPIPLFGNYYQRDMAAAYTNKQYPVKPLPFGIGYQFAEGNSNLMLAKKK
ncbi:MAG: hypothetical protein EAZ85_04215 [Bacteroidetes bacterium]|nr:MAG: hypothetical protein EAZ85_04215 [Bacteroidota bacterium]